MLRAPDLAGRALDGRYELHAVIGEGAFGRVYRGLDRRLARHVAVKVIKPWWAEDRAWVERFQREAQLLARVSDPGIVQIFDVGHAEEGPYYVAELVDGESLADRLRRGPLPVPDALAIAEQLCSALASAHAQGVVHCDVKPANVLLAPNGRVKVGDFGVARLIEGTSQATSGTIAGTPRYMSPEQALGRPTTSATDVYSAGIVLYEMLAGEPPFMHGSAVELGLRHLQDPPPPLPDEIPPTLCRVVDRALAKDPADRYPDGAAMSAALRETDPAPTATSAATATSAVARRALSAPTRVPAGAPETIRRLTGGPGRPGSSGQSPTSSVPRAGS
jgi:serine/threonine protein kinase